MRIVVTGAFGFLGTQLVTTLLRRGTFRERPIDELVLTDQRVPADSPLTRNPRVTIVQGDLLASIDTVFEAPADAIMHLAAAVSAECENDFDLGMRSNLRATTSLLDAARAQSTHRGPVPVVLFSSSVAVYGSDPTLPASGPVTEATLPVPQSSYGTQKYACEQLVADYTRKGYLDGRVARLMTVAIRPGVPNGAASGFLSGMIREPLAGIPSVVPVHPDLKVALASPRSTISGVLALAEAERGTRPGRLAGRLPVNLPALTVAVRDMHATLRKVAGDRVADLVTFEPDPAIERIVGSWPAHFDNARATDLGIRPDSDFETVVRQYMDDHPGAVTGLGRSASRPAARR